MSSANRGARKHSEPAVALLSPSLGHGTYGAVHKGYVRGFPELQHLENHAIAIKSPFQQPSGGAGVPQMQLREVVAMCSIPPHPNIMPFHAGIIEEGARGTGLHILMPCAQGTAKSFLKVKPLSCEEILRWSSHLADAVAHLHAHGWIHRDIKLENCMIFDGALVLGDLGLTRLSMMDAAAPLVPNASSDVQMTTDVCTETTRAPEVFIAEASGAPTTYDYGLPSDIWSLGACCLAMACGGYVFRSSAHGAKDALTSIWKLLGRPTEWRLVKDAASFPAPTDAVAALRAQAAGRKDLPDAWWFAVEKLLRVLPWTRSTALQASESFRSLSVPTALKQESAGNTPELKWQGFSGTPRVLLRGGVAARCSVAESATLKCMVACWDASRSLALAPLAGFAAQILLARAHLHVIPSKHLAGACLSLAAKCCMFSAPSVNAVAAALRVSEAVVARCEWQVLQCLGGQLLSEELRCALRLWPPRLHQGLSGNPLSVCLVSALLALHPGTEVVVAFQDAEIMLRGTAPGPMAQHARIARLVQACKSGECMSYFRAWPSAWADSTAAIRAWASSIRISSE